MKKKTKFFNQKYPSRLVGILKISVGLFLLIACSGKKGDGQEEIDIYQLKGDTIIIKENTTVLSSLSYYDVYEEDYSFELTTAGTVRAIPTQYAVIAPPFAGRILTSSVRLGQKVQPGSALFSISSPDYYAAQKEYSDAKQEYIQAERNLKRQNDLIAHGVGVQREMEEAETDFSTKKTALSNAKAALKIFSANADNISLGQPLVVTSPIKGEVVSSNIVLGQYLKEDAEPLLVIAELSKVWIVGQVKEKDIRFINELEKVEVKIAALPEKKIEGKIYHINEIVDEATRSIEVLIECDNIDHTLKPGMYVTARFNDTPSKAVFVPAKSVLQFNDKSYVIVKIGDNKFIKKYVTTGVTDNGRVQILEGIDRGDKVINEGAFYLLDAK